MAEVIVGLGLIVAGAAFALPGVRLLTRPRSSRDVEWERRHPIRAFLLSPTAPLSGVSWDRYGAVTWLVGGVFLILLGAAVLISAL